jgi:hypothetical protein
VIAALEFPSMKNGAARRVEVRQTVIQWPQKSGRVAAGFCEAQRKFASQ